MHTSRRPLLLVPSLPVGFGIATQNNLKPDFIRDAQERGLGVMAWTVNSAEEMEMVMMTGVNAIVTDHPEKIAVVSAKVGSLEKMKNSLVRTRSF